MMTLLEFLQEYGVEELIEAERNSREKRWDITWAKGGRELHFYCLKCGDTFFEVPRRGVAVKRARTEKASWRCLHTDTTWHLRCRCGSAIVIGNEELKETHEHSGILWQAGIELHESSKNLRRRRQEYEEQEKKDVDNRRPFLI